MGFLGALVNKLFFLFCVSLCMTVWVFGGSDLFNQYVAPDVPEPWRTLGGFFIPGFVGTVLAAMVVFYVRRRREAG